MKNKKLIIITTAILLILILIGGIIYYKSTNWEQIKHKEELIRIKKWKERVSLWPLRRLPVGTKFKLKNEIVILPNSRHFDISNTTDLMIDLVFQPSEKKRILNKGYEFTVKNKKIMDCSHYYPQLSESISTENDDKNHPKCLILYLDNGFILKMDMYDWKKQEWLIGDIEKYIEIIHPFTIYKKDE